MKQGSEAELRVEAKKLANSIDTVKENLDLLKDENMKLIDENEELRQASLDGIEIAMAVQELTKEREQLSVDLADRAVTIKKLLEENQNLNNTLQEVDKEMERLKSSVHWNFLQYIFKFFISEFNTVNISIYRINTEGRAWVFIELIQ